MIYNEVSVKELIVLFVVVAALAFIIYKAYRK